MFPGFLNLPTAEQLLYLYLSAFIEEITMIRTPGKGYYGAAPSRSYLKDVISQQ